MKPTSTKSFSSFEEARQNNFEGMELPEEFYKGDLAIIVGYENMKAFFEYLQNARRIPNQTYKWVIEGGIENLPEHLKKEDLTVYWQENILRATNAQVCVGGLLKETHHIETYLFPYDCEAILDLL
jgi:hypothetical protein